MIGSDTFSSVFGGAPSHTAEHLVEHVRAIVRAGWSPVLLRPGTKEPPCILSAAQAKAADRAEQQRLLAMNPRAKVDGRRHPCGSAHVIDDPAKVKAIVERFVTQHGGANIGLHLGRSRLLAVDVDTPAEREAFRAAWPERPGPEHPMTQVPGITVESPGSYRNGEWVHWGGGHWVFQLEDTDELPAGKVMKGPGGWAAMWGNSYILTPPSSRPEGPYRLVGGATRRPDWLWEQVSEHGALRTMNRDDDVRRALAGGPIDQWSAATSWESLLAPAGWIETSMVEGSCGCPVWTAPGLHSSPKSGTAHDLGCGRFDISEGWGPLKIWTDNPPVGLPPEGAVTKLQFVALTEHGGDIGAATSALAIPRAPAEPLFSVPDSWAAPPGLQGPDVSGHPAAAGQHTDAWGSVGDPVDPGVAPVGSSPAGAGPSWGSVDLLPYLNGTYVPAVPALLQRSDGVCLLYPGLTHSIHGESESGKSWIVQWECARQIRAGNAVLYVDFESDPASVVGRLLLLGCSVDQIMALFDYRRPEKRPAADEEEYTAWLGMLSRRYSLAVIDGVTDAMGIWNLKITDNDEYSAFAKNFPRKLAADTGAATVLVDHVTKDKDGRGRFAIGGQAKMATLDGAAYVVDVVEPLAKGLRGVLSLGVAKDRGGAVRGHGGRMRSDRTQAIAQFIFDSTDPARPLVTLQPQEDETAAALAVRDHRSAAVVTYLTTYPGESQSAISRATGIRPADLGGVIRDLEADGVVVIERIGQKHAHTVIAPINSE